MNPSIREGALRLALADARKSSISDQLVSDGDQAASDGDQTASDADQTGADRDQKASDQDQATADRDRAALGALSTAAARAYESSRKERERASSERLGNRFSRLANARDRHEAGGDRGRMAEIRDEGSRGRDAAAAGLEFPVSEREVLLLRQVRDLRAEAAAGRAKAAEERARAGADRALAARERARLEADLRAVHLDGLTGAYGRQMGRVAISNEIDRARRSGEPLVVAFVGVDELKTVNDRDGSAAGDLVLQRVVGAMRERLRSFDPVIRYGGDEFVCGLGGTDLAEAARRFDRMSVEVEAATGVGISVGFAALEPGDSADALVERADAAMTGVKAARRTEQERTRRTH